MIRTYLLLLALTAAVCAASLFVGAGDLFDERLSSTLLTLRLARLGAAFLAGAALAVGGAVVQALFKNPLASPSILGTTSGAELGGKLCLLLFDVLLGSRLGSRITAEMLLPLGCVVGAVLALLLLLIIHRLTDDILFLLLTGFLLSSLLGSISSFLTNLAGERPELARAMLAFGLGDVSGVGLRRVALAAPLVVGGVAAAFLWARPLDLLLSGEEEAAALGVEVAHVRWASVIWTAVLAAAAVSVGGSVTFVGLIVPHALRAAVGIRHRALIPACALMGGTFLVACDMLARSAPLDTEIPLGVITGLIGAPLFLVLLFRFRRELSHD